MAEENNKGTWVGDPTNLTSFNAFGVVTLEDGQTVNVQVTGRHGMSAVRMYEDFKNFVALLNTMAQDSEVKFWDGQKREKSRESTSPARQESQEPKKYEDNFVASRVLVKYENGKPYYSVSSSGKFPKFPVRVWPEVLEEAQIDENSVNPKDGLDIHGYIAHFERGDNNMPRKIVKLEDPNPY